MEKNAFLDLLEKDLDQYNGVNEDSIESLLNHISNLHNTVGRSYEYLVEVISSLVKSAQQGKANEQAQKSIKGYEGQITELKAKIRDLEQDLARSRERASQLERASSKKDETIQDLEDQLEKANEKIKANTRKDFTLFKLSADRDYTTREESAKSNESAEKNTSLKRKYDDISISKQAVGLLDVEENELDRSKSSTKSKKGYGEEEADGFDDFKFKKVFKKVKKNENSKESKMSREDEHASSNPILMAFNSKKQNEITVTRPSQSVNFDDDSSLQNLLNNFLDNKETSITSKSNFRRDSRKEEASKSVSSPVHRLVPKNDDYNDDYNFDGLNDKIYRKGGPSVAFSQKSPLKELDLPFEESKGVSQIPITRGGRFGTSNNLMQKMMMGNKKRNSTEPNNMFKMSSQRNFEKPTEPAKGKTSVEDADLVRESHRSKREREGLQGYGCDQCDKFYNHIADGIHIKSAEEITDRCSRHRDKFPLPSTPEKFHDNFSLNTQD